MFEQREERVSGSRIFWIKGNPRVCRKRAKLEELDETATPCQPRPVTRSSSRRRHSLGLLSPSPFYCPSVRFLTTFVSTSLYFRLPNGAAAKQRGWAPGAGSMQRAFVSALLPPGSSPNPPLPSSHTNTPSSLSAFHNFPFLCTVCSLFRLITGYLAFRGRKETRNAAGSGGGEGRRRVNATREKEKSRPLRKLAEAASAGKGPILTFHPIERRVNFLRAGRVAEIRQLVSLTSYCYCSLRIGVKSCADMSERELVTCSLKETVYLVL